MTASRWRSEVNTETRSACHSGPVSHGNLIRGGDPIPRWRLELFCLGPRAVDARRELSAREVRSVLSRWLSIEPWRAQLRAYAAREIRVEARTDDALLDRMCALLGPRGLALSREARVGLQARPTRLETGEILAEPLQDSPLGDPAHWIHVVVLDQDDRPFAGARYRLVLTDGRVREGRTDADGGVYVDDISAGVCEISLLEYDEALWNLAGPS
jgi:hypothetical protein